MRTATRWLAILVICPVGCEPETAPVDTEPPSLSLGTTRTTSPTPSTIVPSVRFKETGEDFPRTVHHEFLAVGVTTPMHLRGGCGEDILIGEEWYSADRTLGPRLVEGKWDLSDVPADWELLASGLGFDPPSYVILDAVVERLDERTLQARNADSGELIAFYVLDDTVAARRLLCF